MDKNSAKWLVRNSPWTRELLLSNVDGKMEKHKDQHHNVVFYEYNPFLSIHLLNSICRIFATAASHSRANQNYVAVRQIQVFGVLFQTILFFPIIYAQKSILFAPKCPPFFFFPPQLLQPGFLTCQVCVPMNVSKLGPVKFCFYFFSEQLTIFPPTFSLLLRHPSSSLKLKLSVSPGMIS